MASTTSRSSSTTKTTKRAPARKRATKESAPEESSTEESPAKKTATRKTAAKKRPARKSTSSDSDGAPSRDESSGPRRRSAAKTEARPAARAGQVAAKAAGELLELTGKAAEGVTGLERTEDGWTVQVEVVEVRRIPDTTDVLALYEVQTDSQGSLQGYRRVRRYTRGTPGES